MSSRLATSIKVEAMNSVSKQQCIDIKYRFTLCNRDSCHKPKPLRRANAAKQRFCQSQFIREILPIGSKQACKPSVFFKRICTWNLEKHPSKSNELGIHTQDARIQVIPKYRRRKDPSNCGGRDFLSPCRCLYQMFLSVSDVSCKLLKE